MLVEVKGNERLGRFYWSSRTEAGRLLRLSAGVKGWAALLKAFFWKRNPFDQKLPSNLSQVCQKPH
jgi:hypothetical protein